jgi:hypothetical protein
MSLITALAIVQSEHRASVEEKNTRFREVLRALEHGVSPEIISMIKHFKPFPEIGNFPLPQPDGNGVIRFEIPRYGDLLQRLDKIYDAKN